MIEEKYISMRGYKDITRKTFMGKILMAKNQLLSCEIASRPIQMAYTIANKIAKAKNRSSDSIAILLVM